MLLTDPSLTTAVILFAVAAVVIVIAGTRLSGLADRLADVTGLGEALVGALFLGACTSLPGITASVIAAIDLRPNLALANAVGGIAVQTAFLGIADISYRRANLEHAAASVLNMMQSALLLAMLAILLLGMFVPEVSVWGIHPITPLLFLAYILGLRMIHRSRSLPTWKAEITAETTPDKPDEPVTAGPIRHSIWRRFIFSAAVVIVAGWVLTKAAESIADKTPLTDTVVGALFTAVTTSLPELVTSIAAVRRGALVLAVGGVIGGNAFDTLFAAIADIAYRPGSLYHAARHGPGAEGEIVLIILTMLMTSILLLGLLCREKRGWGNIGFESVLVLALYVVGVVLTIVM